MNSKSIAVRWKGKNYRLIGNVKIDLNKKITPSK